MEIMLAFSKKPSKSNLDSFMLSGGNFHHWGRYAVLFFFFGGVNIGGLTQKTLEQLFCSRLWPDQFVDKLFSRY